jgi:trehalose 6-phosphate phosphatase
VTLSTSETIVRDSLLPLHQHPERSAILCDVDGTLAPIVANPDEAVVPTDARELLARLAERYALVGCVSGRRAEDARRLVGIDGLTYAGNHGLELLAPGAAEPELPRELSTEARRVRAFATEAYGEELRRLNVRLEDKDSIWSFHWREAVDEPAALEQLEDVASRAQRGGLVPHWGRKVLEIRPPLEVDKGTAVRRMLERAQGQAALYAGDDATDLDAFRELRRLERARALAHAVCVGVRSDEGPAAIVGDADLVVEGPKGFLELLAILAGDRSCASPTS